MTEFIRQRGRAIAVFAFSVLSLCLFALATYIASGIFSKWYGIIAGVILMILGIPCHLLGRKSFFGYILCFALNTVGMGCCACAYYVTSGVSYEISSLIPAVLLPIAILFIGCVILTVFPSVKEPTIVVMAVLEAGLIIASIVFWCIRGGEFYAFSLFSLAVAGFYTAVYAFTVNEPERKLLRDISFGSFGAFLAITVIVLIILSEGDALDCGDCELKKSKKKK